jgi:hypothetical protein
LGGADVIDMGNGSNVLVMTKGGNLTVKNFNPGQDKLNLAGLKINAAS